MYREKIRHSLPIQMTHRVGTERIGSRCTVNLRNTDDSASPAISGVAGLQWQVAVTPAEVILLRVHDEGATDDVVGPAQGDHGVGDVDLGHARGVGPHVAEVADVTNGVLGGAVIYLSGTRALLIWLVDVRVAWSFHTCTHTRPTVSRGLKSRYASGAWWI